jgi:hypothetical protein
MNKLMQGPSPEERRQMEAQAAEEALRENLEMEKAAFIRRRQEALDRFKLDEATKPPK